MIATNEPTGFAGLGLGESLLQVLREVGYESPSPIQARTIPSLLAGRDVLGQAQTGTGKTAAFALPILEQLDLSRREPQALVLVPTRELALQVAEAFQRYAAHLEGFHVLPIYGGQAYPVQLRPLARGVHVIVSTPGRLMDHMRRGTVKLDSVRHIVLDEADEMLRMGFIDDVKWILDEGPSERQVALFSATLPHTIRNIAAQYLSEPEEVRVEVTESAAEAIRQRYQLVGNKNKLDALTRLLEVETFDGMIIFVRTKVETVELSEKLEARGYASAPLNGDIPQRQREQTVERLKTGKFDLLVATDVAARGLDVDRLSHVINYDMPIDTGAYVHRIGRTGRAGRKGEAILFVTPREKRMLSQIERATNARLEKLRLPTTDEVNAQRIARFKARITETLGDERVEFFSELMGEYLEESEASPKMICAALALMAQGDQPLLLQERPKFANERADRRDSDRRDRALESGGKRRWKDSGPEPGMQNYRLEVGHKHGVQPGHIVGAITNEADITGGHIGRIQIFEYFTTIGLREGMPHEVFRVLSRAKVCGRELRLSIDQGPPKGRKQGHPGHHDSGKPFGGKGFVRKGPWNGKGAGGGFKKKRFAKDRG